jgi:hypothetical protein
MTKKAVFLQPANKKVDLFFGHSSISAAIYPLICVIQEDIK